MWSLTDGNPTLTGIYPYLTGNFSSPAHANYTQGFTGEFTAHQRNQNCSHASCCLRRFNKYRGHNWVGNLLFRSDCWDFHVIKHHSSSYYFYITPNDI